MNTGDGWYPRFGDVQAALGLLTRLPAGADHRLAAARGAAAAWAWPLAGMTVGLLGAAAGGLALWLGLGPAAAAVIVIGTQIMVTGGLHEDGLADTADGLWGGWDKARRLAIMKDSRIGTYGVLALIIVTLLRWVALTALFAAGTPWAALIAAGAMSRVPMAGLMAALPNARDTGLSQSVGRPGAAPLGLAVALALACGGVALGAVTIAAALWACVATAALGLVARSKIGGQTGDVLGASQQLAEVIVLTVAAAALGA